MTGRQGYLWTFSSLVAGLFFAMGHRGDTFFVVPALFFALALVRSNQPATPLYGALLGLTESLSVVEVWNLSLSAGCVSGILFGVYRALLLQGLALLVQRRGFSPWMLGVAWGLGEAIHALLPLSVPNVLGETLIDTPFVFLIGGLGTLGASAIMVIAVASLLSPKRVLLPSALAVLLLVGALGAAQRAPEGVAFSESTVDILMVRGGLRPSDYANVDGLGRYRTLTDASTRATHRLIVWPETATGDVWNRDDEFMRVIQEYGYQVPILVGATRLEDDGRLYNGALFADESGVQILDKHRRVWPIEQSYAAGSAGRVINTTVGRLRVLICADILTPFSSLSFTAAPPDGLIVLADSTMFAGSELARMHVRRARARSIEAGVPTIFVEQSERLVVIDARGEIVTEDVSSFEPGTLSTEFPMAYRPKSGLYWVAVWGLLCAGALAEGLWIRRQT